MRNNYTLPFIKQQKIKKMKKIYALLTCISITAAAFATTYPGNGKTGFGGPVGTGSLEITNSADSISFRLIRGTGSMNDALVIYLDVTTGGFATTNLFNDQTDGLTKAIGGYDNTIGTGTGRSVFNFSASFRPEFALAFKPGEASAKLVALKDAAVFTLLESPALSNNTATAASYTVKIKASDLGLTSCISFKFIATCISTTAYRSEEAIGDPMTAFVQGWNPYTSTTAPLSYLSCAAPTGLAVTNITATSAKLSWTAVPCAIGYQYLIRKKGTTAWVTVQLMGTSKTATGLTASTTYQWKTLTGCRITPDTVASPYTMGPEFTTTATPSIINNGNVKAFTASLSPNPAINSSMVKITGASGPVTVIVTNLAGTVLWNSAGNTNNMIAIPANKLNKGIYSVTVKDNEHSEVLSLLVE